VSSSSLQTLSAFASNAGELAPGHSFVGVHWIELSRMLQSVRVDGALSRTKDHFAPLSNPDKKAELLLKDACKVLVLLCAATPSLPAAPEPVALAEPSKEMYARKLFFLFFRLP
jgi:hypothetical protein